MDTYWAPLADQAGIGWGLVDRRSPVKRSTLLIAAGVVLAVSPVVVVGATAMGLTVMSAAIVPAPCATAGERTAACTDEAPPTLDPAWNVAVPNLRTVSVVRQLWQRLLPSGAVAAMWRRGTGRWTSTAPA